MVFSTYYISSSFKECSRVIVEGMFIEYLRMVSNWHLFAVKNSLSHVGDQLVTEPRLFDRFRTIHLSIQNIQYALCDGSYDSRSSSTSNHKV